METNFENGQYAEEQLKLILEREDLLYKMASKMKTIRGYLSELREIRTTLKMADALVQIPTIIDSIND